MKMYDALIEHLGNRNIFGSVTSIKSSLMGSFGQSEHIICTYGNSINNLKLFKGI